MNLLIETQYLPSIEFFARLSHHDTCMIEACENYIKQTFRNRCNILTANGPLSLTVPVCKGNTRYIKDIRIDQDQRWAKIHWRAIQSAYGKAPYFEYYEEYFRPIYESAPTFLLDLNTTILSKCLQILKTKIPVSFTETYEVLTDSNSADYRNFYLPNTFAPVYTTDVRLKYYQVFGREFVSNLSILDLIMNEGTNSTEIVYSYSNYL